MKITSESYCDVDESCPWFFIYRDCPSLPQPALNVLSIYMWYWAGEISLRWVQFDLLASRDLLRWFGGSEGKGTCTSPSLLGHWHWISAFAYVHWGYQLRISQLNSGVCESFKKTGNGGKSSFWSPPVSLGSTKFSKTCIACTTCCKFPYPFNSNIVFIAKLAKTFSYPKKFNTLWYI